MPPSRFLFPASPSEAKLDRLGGQTFGKTKARVEKQVRKMADELLRLYAERQTVPADALPEDHAGVCQQPIAERQ